MWKRSNSSKLNCWEVKQCGRQPGGEHVESLGLCQAALEKRLHGVHGGEKGGRACWVIAGTLCQGKVQGVFAKKYRTCKECDFYRMVHVEEGPNFMSPDLLLRRMDAVLV